MEVNTCIVLRNVQEGGVIDFCPINKNQHDMNKLCDKLFFSLGEKKGVREEQNIRLARIV